MQETQCDELGVSGGLGEPRLGLKLWLGSVHLMEDNSSKSWFLFLDLPYLVIDIGFDLCMFMSMKGQPNPRLFGVTVLLYLGEEEGGLSDVSVQRQCQGKGGWGCAIENRS